ncbi:hypothetical protein [Methylobacterium sp. ap11]|uniref:hypothetical protein n=1 Tax=Methylobacterium sp. ap11 TaxID=1761799 RepID=UPI00116078F0|nr:hypothetical protein [Methylobacterium sp. ap11]
MIDQNPIDALMRKRSANAARITRLSERLATLQRDNEEILVAIRALEKLGFKGAPLGRLDDQPVTSGVQTKLIDITVPDMIFAILSEDIWGEGVDATTIISEIKRRYMPDPDPNIIRPTLWRLAKAKRLVKSGGKYFLPDSSSTEEEEEDESEPSGSSSSKNEPSNGRASDGSGAESEYEDDIL